MWDKAAYDDQILNLNTKISELEASLRAKQTAEVPKLAERRPSVHLVDNAVPGDSFHDTQLKNVQQTELNKCKQELETLRRLLRETEDTMGLRARQEDVLKV